MHPKSSWFDFSSVAMEHLEILASNERYTNRLSRQNTEDDTGQTPRTSYTELVATLKSNKTKKSQTLITQDVKTLVVLD